MSSQSLRKAEEDVLSALVKLNQTPGMMLNRQTLAKNWCSGLADRGPEDLERAIQVLLSKGLVRENALKTAIGLTSAGYAQIPH